MAVVEKTVDIIGDERFTAMLLAKDIPEDCPVDLYDEVVQQVRSYAMYKMGKLQSAIFPRVTTVGNYAFYDCSTLKKAEMLLCKTLGERAFQNCPQLEEIEMPLVMYLNSSCFAGCTALTKAIFPSVTIMYGSGVFSGCPNLKTVNFQKMTNMGSGCFYDNPSLEQIDLPSIQVIGSAAFRGCTGLKTVNIGPNIASIPADVFSGTSSDLVINLAVSEGAVANAPWGATDATINYDVPYAGDIPMKKSLSGNTWAGSVWDGKSVYTKQTKEQNADGSYVTIPADFRKYSCIEDSIADHSAYLLGAMNGSKQRYAELKGCTDYRKAVQIIKDGGYATSHSYVSNLCSIIERWNLTQYDTAEAVTSAPAADAWYRVRKSWGDAASQVGAFKVLDNAKACADEHPGFYVFDPDGVQVYTPKTSVVVPFLVRVSIRDLNIRKGPGTNFKKTGQYTGIGVFTIVEVADGQGSSSGWGRLKSGAGWCSLDFCQKI